MGSIGLKVLRNMYWWSYCHFHVSGNSIRYEEAAISEEAFSQHCSWFFRLCIFCGEQNDTFNEEGLDIHYWKSCPMLKRCQSCSQVIWFSCCKFAFVFGWCFSVTCCAESKQKFWIYSKSIFFKKKEKNSRNQFELVRLGSCSEIDPHLWHFW